MKIIYINSTMVHIAGTEKIIIDKMNYLADQMNQEVYFLTYEQGKHEFPFKLSNNVKHIDLNIRFFKIYQLSFFKKYIKRYFLQKKFTLSLKKTFDDIKPDIIICTSYNPKEIITLSKIKTNAIKIIESHIIKDHMGRCFEYKKDLVKYTLAVIENIYLNKAIKKFNCIITLTKEDASLWKKLNNAVYTIPNFITPYPQVSSTCKNKQAISVGRLCKQKGFDILISSWIIVAQKYPEWKLSIYGEGEDKEKLEKLIIDNQLEDKIKIMNPIHNIYEKYIDSSIYIMSSRYEGFGLVLMEAMSCGIPCISFNCPSGPRDIISNNEDGILINNIDSISLAEKIIYFIENEEKRIQMGRKAKENIKRFLPDKIMPLWINLFSNLINNPNRV